MDRYKSQAALVVGSGKTRGVRKGRELKTEMANCRSDLPLSMSLSGSIKALSYEFNRDN